MNCPGTVPEVKSRYFQYYDIIKLQKGIMYHYFRFFDFSFFLSLYILIFYSPFLSPGKKKKSESPGDMNFEGILSISNPTFYEVEHLISRVREFIDS
jgi:hypothetical protein